MKKYVVLIAVTSAVVATILFLPGMLTGLVTGVEVVQMAQVNEMPTVEADGVLSEQNKTEMTAQIPMVVSEVYAKEGDAVEVGDVLAAVDQNKTVEAIASVAGELSDYMPSAVDQALAQSDFSEEIDANTFPEEIVATASGVLSSVNLQQGALMFPGQVMASISDLSQLCVIASVDEAAISQVAVGQAVTIAGDALGDKTYKGSVTALAPTAKTQLSGLTNKTVVEVTVTIQNPDEMLRPGYHVKAEIATGETNTYQILPYEAILQDDNQKEYVYLYQDGYAVRQNIVTGKEMQQGAEVTNGVAPEDYVIFPAQGVKDKERVRVTKEVCQWNS